MAVIFEKYVAVVSNKYVAVISDNYVAVISYKYAAFLSDGRRPKYKLFSVRQVLTISEIKVLALLFPKKFVVFN